jgi:hypothetical protein
MQTRSAKAKGRKLALWVVNKIRSLFDLPEEDVVATNSGVPGIDVQLSNKAREFFPYSVECKNYARIAIYQWWDQAVANQGELTPLLVVKANRREPLVILSWDTFEGLIKNAD